VATDWDVMTDFTVANTTAANTAWNSLFTFVNSADLTSAANYQTVANQVDLTNFVDYYLLHIHGDSEDWPHHNGYAVRNHSVPGAKWTFIPWDQEIIMDPTLNVDRLSASAPNTTTDKTAGRLYQKLRVNAEFRLLFADRAHRHLHNGGALSVAAEQARWQAFANTLDKAIVAESARWGDVADSTPYGNAVPAGRVFTREADWLPSVAAVRDSHFANLQSTTLAYATIPELKAQSLYPATEPPAFATFGGNVPINFNLTISAPAGTIYYTLNGTDPRVAVTGAVQGTAYSGPVPLTATGVVKARARSAGGEWSALTEALFVVGTAASSANLAVTELNYHPASIEDEEFVELTNFSAGPIDLTGVSFVGITFTFADGTLLAAGERIVVVRNSAAFVARYGASPRVAGVYTGALDNSGEEIAVIAANGADIVRFTYGDKAPWPLAPDGGGRTLTLRRPEISPTVATNWRSSTAAGGSPGASDAAVTFSGSALADADADGFPALVEHALNGNDSIPNDVIRPVTSVESLTVGGVVGLYFTISAQVRTNADDATLAGEFATTPGAWSAAVDLGEVIALDGTVSRRWRAPVPYTGATQQFLRLKATLTP
jgi:hypothetical protein